MAKRRIKRNSIDQTIDVFIQDSSSTTGTGLSGLEFSATGLSCYYRKGATGLSTDLPLSAQTITGAHLDGGFVEIDADNMTGVYKLNLSDDIVTTTEPYSVIVLQGATNMAPCLVELELTDYITDDLYNTSADIPGQKTPTSSAPPIEFLSFLYKAWRNKTVQTSAFYYLLGDDETTVEQKAAVSDDGTSATSNEVTTGP